MSTKLPACNWQVLTPAGRPVTSLDVPAARTNEPFPLSPANVETLLEVVRREGELLTFTQAGRALGVSHQRVSFLVAGGTLPCVEVLGHPYIPARAVEARKAAGVRNGRPPRPKLLEACC